MANNSDSSLISEVILLPKSNYSEKKSKTVKKITPHHAAGVNASLRGMANVWKGKTVSANYGIDSQGKIALYVHEKDRAYTSCNGTNDGQAVTVEIANCKGAPNWEVSDAAVKSFILLSVDICKRNEMPGLTWTGKSNGTLTVHQMFKATACPGPYMMALMPWIAQEVTGRVNGTITGDIVIPKVPGMDPGKKAPTTPVKAPEKPAIIDTNSKPQPEKKWMYGGVDMSPVFNPDYYYHRYEDLRQRIGNDPDALFNHFCKHGLNEARQAISTFNPIVYRSKYADLANLFGDKWIKYYQHYLLHGIAEGRIGY